MKKLVVVTVLGTLMGVPSMSAWAQSADAAAYWQSSGQLRDSYGNCIRTSSWQAGTQVAGCDVIAAAAPVTEADSDQDGVADSKDLCANTPKGATVNAQGCIPMKPVTFKLDVKFEHNSAQLQDAYKDDIAVLARLLTQDQEVKAVIHGHTDSTGSDAYNQKLSEKRAQAVVESLVVEHAIAAERLSAEGHGESAPVADNASREGRQQNRRVEVQIQAQVPQQ